jgi:hypothetical protein
MQTQDGLLAEPVYPRRAGAITSGRPFGATLAGPRRHASVDCDPGLREPQAADASRYRSAAQSMKTRRRGESCRAVSGPLIAPSSALASGRLSDVV